jgi:hypothetical protein
MTQCCVCLPVHLPAAGFGLRVTWPTAQRCKAQTAPKLSVWETKAPAGVAGRESALVPVLQAPTTAATCQLSISCVLHALPPLSVLNDEVVTA